MGFCLKVSCTDQLPNTAAKSEFLLHNPMKKWIGGRINIVQMKSERSNTYMYGKEQKGLRENAIKYYMEHKELWMKGYVANLYISKTSIK